MTPDLRTTYMGLELSSPLVASASPLTGDLGTLRALEEAGAAAVVLPSLFEEQVEHEAAQVHQVLEQGTHSFGEALTYFPEMDDYNTGPDEYVEHVAAATAELGIPVIASLNGVTPGGWVRYADLLQQAGADAIELNIYAVETDMYASAASVEDRTLRLVSQVNAAISIPLAVKVGPYYTAFAHFAERLSEAGAAALVLFNRFLQPDIDLETLTVRPDLQLSTRDEMRLPLRWIAILRGRIGAQLAATSGVQATDDVLKLLLAGADVVMLASHLLRRGPGLLTELTDGLNEWLAHNEYESISQLRGSMSQESCGNPRAFERAQYVRALVEEAHARAPQPTDS